MEINEAAGLLRMNREEVKIAIVDGIRLPISNEIIHLKAEIIGGNYDVDEESLNRFIECFDKEEPGRHPPTAVRRALLVEANHRCAVCSQPAPIEFHHIIEFSKLKHYDVQHMLALCPTCHRMCSLGDIDLQAQRNYKERLKSHRNGASSKSLSDFIGPADFSWDDLREVITALHSSFVPDEAVDSESKYDFSHIDVERKNELNAMSAHYFQTVVLEEHEPYFGRIHAFLKSPINNEIAELYYEIVDELRSKIALNRERFEKFESFLVQFADVAAASLSGTARRRRALNILLSFMYVNCDIGRK